jgi:hypothetical protein
MSPRSVHTEIDRILEPRRVRVTGDIGHEPVCMAEPIGGHT